MKFIAIVLVLSTLSAIRGSNPTIYERDFNATNDCYDLNRALRGATTIDTKIIRVLTERTNAQRQVISKEYAAKYNIKLEDEIEDKMTGWFKTLLLTLLLEPAVDDARKMKSEMGFETATEILITRSPKEIEKIEKIYKEENNGETLETAISANADASLSKLMLALLKKNRASPNEQIDAQKTELAAKKLYEAGKASGGQGNEDVYIELFTKLNFDQLKAVADKYQETYKHLLDEGVIGTFSGFFMEGLLATLVMARRNSGYFAELLRRTMRGLGTDEESLIRLLVSRSEIDLADIRTEFDRVNEDSLAQWITDDTSGSFRDALISILLGNQYD